MKVNGEEISVTNGVILEKWLKENGYCLNKIAVEINNNIIPKAEYKNHTLYKDDVLEIVSFVGGG